MWIKNEKTGLEYRPIYKDIYPEIAYNSGFDDPSVFLVTKLGELKFDEKNKLNGDKSLYKKWKKIYVIYAFEADKKFMSQLPYCEVNMESLPSELEEEIFDIYVRPSIKDYVKPETYKTFKNIV
jgi:hypothetical protein